MTVRIRNGTPYVYRSIKRGGRVRTAYLGSGPVGLAMASLWQADRDAERHQRDLHRERRRADDERRRPVIEWSGRVERAVRAALEAAGYHRHKRSEWRRRKVMERKTTNHAIQPAPAAPTAPAKATPVPLTPELRAVERRWLDGDLDFSGRIAVRGPGVPARRFLRPAYLLGNNGDRVALAKSWGLRLTSPTDLGPVTGRFTLTSP